MGRERKKPACSAGFLRVVVTGQRPDPPTYDARAARRGGAAAAWTRGAAFATFARAIERGLDFLYLCYDNEGYANTGQQYSPATPHAARTATSSGRQGYPGYKKDLFDIWVAHRPVYVATAIASEPLDLARKIAKAKTLKGPRLVIALAPCPPGWDFEPQDTAEIGRLAVKSGIWPLKEYADGAVTHTLIPHPRVPVEDYLKRQGRFAHLFEPARNDEMIRDIQARVDAYWAKVA